MPSPDYRELHPGMGQAIAERTVLRRKSGGSWETWGEVADRVALGNSLLCTEQSEQAVEYNLLRKHIANASILMSGRHLQHGDETQPYRNMEVFTNCLDGSTKILTLEYGSVEIGSVVGKVVTVKGKDGEWRPAKISSHGKQKINKVRFGAPNGNLDQFTLEVLVTKNHRWFLNNGTTTQDLQRGDILKGFDHRVKEDSEAVLHGLIFGDGTNHKSRTSKARCEAQGIQYCSIRLCGDSKKWLSLFDGYTVTYPPSASGDPCVYVGRKMWKSLPHTTDPSYIAGFIKGWWMADGYKNYNRNGGIAIATTDEEAVEWLRDYAASAGYIITGISRCPRKSGDGSFNNGLGKTLYWVRLNNTGIRRKVLDIQPIGWAEVFCAEEPITSGFTLSNGLVTGNCATAPSSFLLFYLLLNGAGVGRCYDDDLMVVNWDYAPSLRCVIDETHADFDISAHESVRAAKHKYGKGKDILWYKIPDSREGWAKGLELWENAAFEKIHKDKMLILDFSDVRAKGLPIKGMQNRPSSGPVPMMNAFMKAATLKGSNLEPYQQAMYVDHYFAECVLVGGARRAARMATKHWKDKTILDFITIKRPIEYEGLKVDEIVKCRDDSDSPPQCFLWSANNSVMVDEEFWTLLDRKRGTEEYLEPLAKHARGVLKAITASAYADGTGEPGIINAHKLVQNDEDWQELHRGDYVGSEKYQIFEDTQIMMAKLAKKAKRKKYHTITNPCGEIALNCLGGFCVIADVVPFHCDTLDEAEEAFRVTTRALIRVNTMDSVFSKEVLRTNRIGVSITGIHEFAWKFFGYTFKQLLDENKTKDFWDAVNRFSRAVKDEAASYSAKLGLKLPHTTTTIKPAGTTSKLFGLCEGWHLPAMKRYMRWVQFRSDNPLVEEYRKKGYPTKDLVQYEGTTVVGFPTSLVLANIAPDEKIVTASEATPRQQYRWVELGEKYWIGEERGNQISYTLKYDPSKVAYIDFKNTVQRNQRRVRCCSVMPQIDTTAFEYQPEEAVTIAVFEAVRQTIRDAMVEDIGKEHVKCEGGACPVDFDSDERTE